MKTPLAALACAAALIALPLPAQVNPPAPPAPAATLPADDSVVTLSPFQVDARGNLGYLAQNTLSGSRMNTALKDTPAPISVFTKEFMDDVGVDFVKDLVAPGVSYGHSNGNVQDRAALLPAVKADEMDLLKIETPEQSIAIQGSVAVVRHLFAADFRKAGVPGSLKVGSLQVWQKHQGQWKLLARQAYKL